jgi:predicted dehydrogenase
MDVIRWGIVATGGIAGTFARALRYEAARTGRSELRAVASRDGDKAASFAQKWGVPVSYGSYEALFRDPEIDAVYIATPHNSHPELSIAALRAGKAVLCEKPLGLALADVRPVIETARAERRFFMEAMWMKFNPSFRKAHEWASSGRIGPLRYLRADFSLDAPFDPASRLHDPALGGGALLDIGIYPITFATCFAGKRKPDAIRAVMEPAPTGVDLSNRITLAYSGGLRADLWSGIAVAPIEDLRGAVAVGETGAIRLPYFWMAQRAVLLDHEGRERERFDAPFDCNGYEYEVREVEDCLLAGRIESTVQTWDDSIMVMELLDGVRSAWERF